MKSYANSVIIAAETAVLMSLDGVLYSELPWITMENEVGVPDMVCAATSGRHVSKGKTRTRRGAPYNQRND